MEHLGMRSISHGNSFLLTTLQVLALQGFTLRETLWSQAIVMAHLIWTKKCLKITTILAHHINQRIRGDHQPQPFQLSPQPSIQSRPPTFTPMETQLNSTIQSQLVNRRSSKRVTLWKTTWRRTRTVIRIDRLSRVRALSMCRPRLLLSLDNAGRRPWGLREARRSHPSLIFIRYTHKSLKSIRTVSISLMALSRKQSQVLVRRSELGDWLKYFNLI